MNICKLLFSSLIVMSINTNAVAATFDIDGDLSDWGVSRNGNASDWTPTAGEGIQFTIEDQHSNYLEPGYGGQNYDAEAIYALKGNDKLFIAMATGHDPERSNSGGSYGAGDFAIDFGRDGTYEVGVNVKPAWDGFGVLAGVYKVAEWAYGIWNDNASTGYVKSEHPTSIVSGDQLGLANLAISDAQQGYGEWAKDDHYFYEMSLDLDLLRAAGWQGESFDIHWTMNCANDSIIVDPPANVPAPGALAMMLIGLVGMRMSKNKALQMVEV